MTNVFTFNILDDITNDDYNQTQEAIMNRQFSSYQTTNFHDRTDIQATLLGSSVPAMNFDGGAYGPVSSKEMDVSNRIRSSLITNNGMKITLQERPYLTVPYLGRGSVDVDLENRMRFGEYVKDRKSYLLADEKNTSYVTEDAMLDSLKNTITNPNNLVEESADSNWRRGGDVTQNHYKDEYFKYE